MNRLVLLFLPLAACQQSPDNAAAPEPAKESVALPAPGQLFQAGMWEMATTINSVEMAGAPPEAVNPMIGKTTRAKYCMSPEEARRSPGDLFRKNARGNCSFERFAMSGGRIDALMQCAGGKEGGSSTVEMRGSYSSDRYEMATRMSVSVPSQPTPMTVDATTEGHRTGACI